MVDETIIEEEESTKFLWMHLDRGLTWDDHIESVCSKRYKSSESTHVLCSRDIHNIIHTTVRMWLCASPVYSQRYKSSESTHVLCSRDIHTTVRMWLCASPVYSQRYKSSESTHVLCS
ncbi:hypothetical protein J6590_069728 [Homalodisca vitripennis]|nr:hypothetical protein J6590_069728 [Homalodisca vitripennis]